MPLRIRKRTATLILAGAIVVPIFACILIYSLGQSAAPYTVVGTLTYAPWHAVTPGVSVISVTPSLSPSPGPITFSEPNGQGGSVNYTVDAFMTVTFDSHFAMPQGSLGFPLGFEGNDIVKLTGNITFDNASGLYGMHVTGISHYSP